MQRVKIQEPMRNLTSLRAKLKPPKVGLVSRSGGHPDPARGSLTILAQGRNWNEAPTDVEAVTCRDMRAIPLSAATV